jgi:hypothetical protein
VPPLENLGSILTLRATGKQEMPKFYFEFGDEDGGFDSDPDGIEFPNLEAAYLDAYHSAIDMWAECRHRGKDLRGHQFLIKDSFGRVLVELPLSEASVVRLSRSQSQSILAAGGPRHPPPRA